MDIVAPVAQVVGNVLLVELVEQIFNQELVESKAEQKGQ